MALPSSVRKIVFQWWRIDFKILISQSHKGKPCNYIGGLQLRSTSQLVADQSLSYAFAARMQTAGQLLQNPTRHQPRPHSLLGWRLFLHVSFLPGMDTLTVGVVLGVSTISVDTARCSAKFTTFIQTFFLTVAAVCLLQAWRIPAAVLRMAQTDAWLFPLVSWQSGTSWHASTYGHCPCTKSADYVLVGKLAWQCCQQTK